MKKTEEHVFGPLLTTSNEQRRKELEKWLESVNYDGSDNTLQTMLEDPKAKALLDEQYGHLWGDTALQFSVMEIPSGSLRSTEPILDLDQSLLSALTDKNRLMQLFNEPIVINKPIITFRRNYVVDGHHSWIQAATFNPYKNIVVFDFDSDEISAIEFLRTIRKAVEEDNKNNGQQSSEIKQGFNLFDDKIKSKDIRKYIKKNITEEVVAWCVEHIDDCTNEKSTIEWIVDSLLHVKYNCYPGDV